MEENKKVIVHFERSDGKTFVIDNMGDWYIQNDGLDGIDFADYNLYTTTTAFGTGVVVTGEGYSARNITITARTINPEIVDTVREQARLFFNPQKFNYKLTITYRGRTRWIVGRLSNLSLPSRNVYKNQELKLLFLCPNPFFHGMDEFVDFAIEKKKMWAFPWIDCPTAKITPVVEYAKEIDTVMLSNDSDDEIRPVIEVVFTDTVKYPTIQLEGGHVTMPYTYASGSAFKIDLTQNKVININTGADMTAYMQQGSDLTKMYIAVGGSELRFDSETLQTTGKVGVEMRAIYSQVYGGL